MGVDGRVGTAEAWGLWEEAGQRDLPKVMLIWGPAKPAAVLPCPLRSPSAQPPPPPHAAKCRACLALGRCSPRQQALWYPGWYHLPVAAPNPRRCLPSGWATTTDGDGAGQSCGGQRPSDSPSGIATGAGRGPGGGWQEERAGGPQIFVPAQSLLDSWSSAVCRGQGGGTDPVKGCQFPPHTAQMGRLRPLGEEQLQPGDLPLSPAQDVTLSPPHS